MALSEATQGPQTPDARRVLRHMLVSHCLQAKRSAADGAGYHLGMPISVLRKHPVEHVQMTRHSMTQYDVHTMQ